MTSGAALVGSYGMQAVIDDTNALYVTDDTPNAEPRYRARFYFDPNSITMAEGNAHFIFVAYEGTSSAVIQIFFRYYLGTYKIDTSVRTDTFMSYTEFLFAQR